MARAPEHDPDERFDPAHPPADARNWAEPGAFPPVGNQCVTESCVGWAVGYHAMSWLLRREPRGRKRRLEDPAHQVSPSWIYNFLNEGDGTLGLGSLEIAGRLLTAQGACSMRSMPFTCDPAALPTRRARAEARRNHDRWHRLGLGMARFVAEVLETLPVTVELDQPPLLVPIPRLRIAWKPLREFLARSGPVVIAGRAPRSFQVLRASPDSTETSTVYAPPRGEALGVAHALVLVGFDDDKPDVGRGRGAYLVLNSFGKGWGGGGYAWVPYDVMREWDEANAIDSAIALAWDPEQEWSKWLDVRRHARSWRFDHATAPVRPSAPETCPCPELSRDFSHCPMLVGRTVRLWHTPAHLAGRTPLLVTSPPFPRRRRGVRAEALVLVSGAVAGSEASRRARRRRRRARAPGLPVLVRVGRPRRLADGSVVQVFQVPPELVEAGELTIDLRLVQGRSVIDRRLLRLPEWPGPDPELLGGAVAPPVADVPALGSSLTAAGNPPGER